MEKQKVSIEFDVKELNALLGLIDDAVKANGLQKAEEAVYFKKKIEVSLKSKEDADKKS